MAGAATERAGAVNGGPRALLRLEGAALLLVASWAYCQVGGGWGWFAALFLLPDLALLAYLAGPAWGARAYNLTHTTLLPLGLLAAGWQAGSVAATGAALVWLAHIGLDRMLGYGLKYGSGFADTHLGTLRQPRHARAQAATRAPQ